MSLQFSPCSMLGDNTRQENTDSKGMRMEAGINHNHGSPSSQQIQMLSLANGNVASSWPEGRLERKGSGTSHL